MFAEGEFLDTFIGIRTFALRSSCWAAWTGSRVQPLSPGQADSAVMPLLLSGVSVSSSSEHRALFLTQVRSAN